MRFHQWLAGFAACAAMMWLSACGGSNNNSNNGSNMTPQVMLDSVSVSPANLSIMAGQKQQYQATGSYSDGSNKDVTATATWASSDTSVATVDSTGLATAIQQGSVTISASLQSVHGTTGLTVTALVTTLQVTETDGTNTLTGGGAVILLDGVFAGNIGTSGSATLQVSPGNHTVTILDSGAQGELAVDAVAGATTPAIVTVVDAESISAPSTSQSAQIVGGVFDYTDNTKNPVTIQLLDPSSNPISIVSFASSYLTTATYLTVDLSTYTTVSGQGNIVIDLVSALNTLGSDPATIAANGPFTVQAEVFDANGVPYDSTTTFELGIYKITGMVVAPPSNPALPVGNLPLTFKKHSSTVIYSVTSAADGSLSIGGVPDGQYDVNGSVVSNGTTYNVFGTSLVQSNVKLTIVPLGPIDIANGVVSVATQQGPQQKLSRPKPRRSEPGSTRQRLAGQGKEHLQLPGPYGDPISVVAADEGIPQTATGVYTIPKGTQSVAISYQACTEEYPFYVEEQSEFNDLWSVTAVDAEGNVLVSESHNVNEQLYLPPVWQGNGCTGLLQPTFDVSAATKDSSTTITINISATNIGDSILPTSVDADVTGPPGFTIKSAKVDPPIFIQGSCSTVSSDTSNIQVCHKANNGDYISIPLGKANVFERPATAVLEYPADDPVTVTNVELDVTDESGTMLDTIFNEAPGDNVELSAPDTLEFSVTYPHAPGGTLFGVLPDRIGYLLTVTGTQNGSQAQATKTMAIFNTLWSAVDGGVTVARYGQRDLGGDDWAVQNTIGWMKANAMLLTRYDDISGEHGRNIGHATHGQGANIDIFQFTTLNSSSGQANYNALLAAAVKAAQGDPGSIATVAQWVTQNRAGIDGLNASPNVAYVITGLGCSETGNCKKDGATLPIGWLRDAMNTGMLRRVGGAPIDLGFGSGATWQPTKPPVYRADHLSHIHLVLVF